MKLKILILSFLAVFLMAGSAMAITFGTYDVGKEITISDNIPNGGFNPYWGGGPYGTAVEDNEVERNSIPSQPWDLEGMFWNGSILSIVGGFDYESGVQGWAVGDVFLGALGDDGLFAASHVIALSRNGENLKQLGNYALYDFDGDKIESLHQDHVKPWSNPYKWGDFEDNDGDYQVTDIDVGGYFIGSNHYLLQILANDDLASLINSGTDLHMTLECGNDSIRGSVPEPSTMLLFGTGLLGLAAIGRKKLFKK